MNWQTITVLVLFVMAVAYVIKKIIKQGKTNNHCGNKGCGCK